VNSDPQFLQGREVLKGAKGREGGATCRDTMDVCRISKTTLAGELPGNRKGNTGNFTEGDMASRSLGKVSVFAKKGRKETVG